MFKVMIVDDEIYVVALIRKLVDWEKYQMTVVATANDGITALTLLKEKNPDLVIVDIRMPGYDGIAFMDKVREFNHNVKFIVISGHKHFDYAKGAMRNNVEDYLLKPINREELETVISRVHKKMVQNQKNEIKIKVMEEELDTSKKKVRDFMVESIMKREYKGLDESLENINRHYLTTFHEGYFQMLALHLDAPKTAELSQDKNLLLKEAGKKLREALTDVCEDVLDCEQEHRIIFLIQFRNMHQEQVRNILQSQLREINQKVKKFENLVFLLCVSAESESLREIDRIRQSLWRCMLARTVISKEKLMEPKDLHESETLLEAVLESRGERFEQALPMLNVEEIARYIREMYSKAYYGLEEDTLLYYKLFMTLVDKVWQYFSSIGACTEDEKTFKERFEQIYCETTIAVEYPRILYREIETIINENHLAEQSKEAPAIRIVKGYIQTHYQEDISLSMLAEMVNISPVYLSRLFKKEEGIGFVDYLNQYRLEAAKKLLQDVRYNIIEVADLSGFHNTKYFSKIFKKAVGITPSEYRRRHLGNGI